MSNSNLVSFTQISPNRNSPRNQPISKMTMSFGGGQSHNNMPPYLTVYKWQRIA